MVFVTCFLGFTLVKIGKSIVGCYRQTVAKNRSLTSVIVLASYIQARGNYANLVEMSLFLLYALIELG